MNPDPSAMRTHLFLSGFGKASLKCWKNCSPCEERDT